MGGTGSGLLHRWGTSPTCALAGVDGPGCGRAGPVPVPPHVHLRQGHHGQRAGIAARLQAHRPPVALPHVHFLQDEWLGKIHAALLARGITVLSIVADGGSQNQKSNRRMRWLGNNSHTCSPRWAGGAVQFVAWPGCVQGPCVPTGAAGQGPCWPTSGRGQGPVCRTLGRVGAGPTPPRSCLCNVLPFHCYVHLYKTVRNRLLDGCMRITHGGRECVLSMETLRRVCREYGPVQRWPIELEALQPRLCNAACICTVPTPPQPHPGNVAGHEPPLDVTGHHHHCPPPFPTGTSRTSIWQPFC